MNGQPGRIVLVHEFCQLREGFVASKFKVTPVPDKYAARHGVNEESRRMALEIAQVSLPVIVLVTPVLDHEVSDGVTRGGNQSGLHIIGRSPAPNRQGVSRLAG